MDCSLAVVVPLYKASPSASELSSIEAGFRVLERRQKIIIAPKGLNLAQYGGVLKVCSIRRFEDRFFRSVNSYSRLLLSTRFFERFADFDYILIFQPDAFIFRDDLDDWCARGYDYIGAPWPGGRWVRPWSFRGCRFVAKAVPWFNKSVRRYVGNGGFSLRRVSAALDVLRKHRLLALTWVDNEDMFWAMYSKSVPSESEASLFSLEENPSRYYEQNNRQLPTGTHAWAKNEPEFWRQCSVLKDSALYGT